MSTNIDRFERTHRFHRSFCRQSHSRSKGGRALSPPRAAADARAVQLPVIHPAETRTINVMSKRKAPDKDEEEDVDDPNEDEEAKRRREDREDDEMQERLTKRSSKDRMGCAPTAAPALCCPQPSP